MMSNRMPHGAAIACLALLLAGCAGDAPADVADAATGPDESIEQDDSIEQDNGEEADDSDAPTDDGLSSADPCSLATDDEIAAIMGGAEAARTGPTEEFRGTTCMWDAEDVGIAGAYVLIGVWQGAEFYDPEQQASIEYETLEIGDDAWREQSVVYFIKGETVVMIDVFGIPDQDDVVEIAKRAESRV